jgi:hypothetical protein
MKIRKIAYLSTLFAFLLPALVVATVVISYTYPINVSSTTPKIYLAEGPNYPTASSLGLIYLSSTPTSISNYYYITSGTTIYINAVSGAGNTYLLNVLEIINSTGLTVPTYIWINITGNGISSGSLYYSQGSEIFFDGSELKNSTETQPTQISLSSSSSNQIHLWQSSVYIAIVLGSTASGSATVTIQYTIQ